MKFDAVHKGMLHSYTYCTTKLSHCSHCVTCQANRMNKIHRGLTSLLPYVFVLPIHYSPNELPLVLRLLELPLRSARLGVARFSNTSYLRLTPSVRNTSRKLSKTFSHSTYHGCSHSCSAGQAYLCGPTA